MPSYTPHPGTLLRKPNHKEPTSASLIEREMMKQWAARHLTIYWLPFVWSPWTLLATSSLQSFAWLSLAGSVLIVYFIYFISVLLFCVIVLYQYKQILIHSRSHFHGDIAARVTVLALIGIFFSSLQTVNVFFYDLFDINIQEYFTSTRRRPDHRQVSRKTFPRS